MDWLREPIRGFKFSERLSAGMASRLVYQDRPISRHLLPPCLVRLQRSTDERPAERSHATTGAPRVEFTPAATWAATAGCGSTGAPAPDSFQSRPVGAGRRWRLSGELTRWSGTEMWG
jgi:hypothetical protein